MHLNLRLLPTFLRPRILVIDCGARHVACGSFTTDANDRLVLRQFAFAPHSGDSGPDANWSEATARTLGVIARGEKWRGTGRLALPGGHHLLLKFFRTPAIEKTQRPGMIELEAGKNIPCPLGQVVWDHLTVRDDGANLEIMLAAVKNEVAGAIQQAVDAAGFHISQMVPSSLALLRAFRHSHPDECDRVLVAEIGARATHLVFIDGEHFFIRTFLLGGDAVTQAVADELHLEFALAETLKAEAFSGHLKSVADSPAHDAVRRAAAQFASRLHLEIVRSTLASDGQPGPGRPRTLYLAGGGSLIPELPAMLADKLTLRVVRFEPLRQVTLLPAARAGAMATAPMLAGLVGLATSLADDNWPSLNLLPPTAVQAQAARRRRSILLATAILATAVPLPLIRYYRSVAAANDRSSAGIVKRLDPLRVAAARDAGNLARLGETTRQIEVLRNVIGAKSNWIVFLNDLQDRLAKAEDVWLEKLQLVPLAEAAGKILPAAPAAARSLILSGRLLDKSNPVSKVSPDSYRRVRGLLQLLSQSPFIGTVENERFDNTQPGILRFDVTLVLDPQKPL